MALRRPSVCDGQPCRPFVRAHGPLYDLRLAVRRSRWAIDGRRQGHCDRSTRPQRPATFDPRSPSCRQHVDLSSRTLVRLASYSLRLRLEARRTDCPGCHPAALPARATRRGITDRLPGRGDEPGWIGARILRARRRRALMRASPAMTAGWCCPDVTVTRTWTNATAAGPPHRDRRTPPRNDRPTGEGLHSYERTPGGASGVWPVDGGKRRRRAKPTREACDQWPRWSPTGRRVIFSRLHWGERAVTCSFPSRPTACATDASIRFLRLSIDGPELARTLRVRQLGEARLGGA